jgi:hypothetical protein
LAHRVAEAFDLGERPRLGGSGGFVDDRVGGALDECNDVAGQSGRVYVVGSVPVLRCSAWPSAARRSRHRRFDSASWYARPAMSKAGDVPDEDLVRAEGMTVGASRRWTCDPPPGRRLYEVAQHDCSL